MVESKPFGKPPPVLYPVAKPKTASVCFTWNRSKKTLWIVWSVKSYAYNKKRVVVIFFWVLFFVRAPVIAIKEPKNPLTGIQHLLSLVICPCGTMVFNTWGVESMEEIAAIYT